MHNLDQDIDKMMDQIKQPKQEGFYIFESPDKGKTVFKRFCDGTTKRYPRELVKGESND